MTTARTPRTAGGPVPVTTRGGIVTRAEAWLDPPVPFSRTRFHQDSHGIYRTDDSGYASMAWGLPGMPPDRNGGLDGAGLAALGLPTDVTDLLAGDLLVDGERVAVFHEWDDDRARCWVFELAPDAGTVHRATALTSEHTARRHPRLVR
ncbi:MULTISPECIES: hypothetical protein [Actinosynnema]|uniref:hypothetical protein n=1 Tax=Actinosynnema TaxID=40566 RepID=UPI0020A5DCDF|nr:hypothetical protein [Actinosynnema pretiosum]MCP2098294.1 hypothetical protein [Actinosynnema pretiosum]